MKRYGSFLVGWLMFGLMVVLGVIVGLATLNLIGKLPLIGGVATSAENLATPEGSLFG